MIARVESVQAWLENITYQMCNMSHKDQNDKLAGYVLRHATLAPIHHPCSQIALLKMYITRTGSAIAEDATQIFGGRAVTQSGMGRVIENVRYLPVVPYRF